MQLFNVMLNGINFRHRTYKAAVQNDLWDSLTEQAHNDSTLDRQMTVGDVMDTWTLQKGFPIIQVQRNYADSSAKFTQTKFQIIENATMAKEYESYKWWVPLSYASPSENSDFSSTKPNFWLSKKEKSVTKKVNADESSWMIVNIQQTGKLKLKKLKVVSHCPIYSTPSISNGKNSVNSVLRLLPSQL